LKEINTTAQHAPEHVSDNDSLFHCRDETLLTAQRGGFEQRRSALYKPEGTGLSHQFEFAITI
jgi:hypothetical protein